MGYVSSFEHGFGLLAGAGVEAKVSPYQICYAQIAYHLLVLHQKDFMTLQRQQQ
jgi:hypothetical protein